MKNLKPVLMLKQEPFLGTAAAVAKVIVAAISTLTLTGVLTFAVILHLVPSLALAFEEGATLSSKSSSSRL